MLIIVKKHIFKCYTTNNFRLVSTKADLQYDVLQSVRKAPFTEQGHKVSFKRQIQKVHQDLKPYFFSQLHSVKTRPILPLIGLFPLSDRLI